MRLPGLSSPTVLVLTLSFFLVSTSVAQHGGGGSSAGSSSASSGGFHGGGGTSSGGGSWGGHSSVGSASHASSSGSHASGSRSTTGHFDSSRSHTNSARFPTFDAQGNTATAKRGFFSFLRHPFPHRPTHDSEQASQFRHRVCLNGACRVCAVAQVPGAGGCVTPHIYLRHSTCSHADVWAGGSCLLQTSFMDDCAGPGLLMEQQARRLQEADAARQSQCTDRLSQQCTEMTTNDQRESSLYRVFQDKYRQCRLRSRGSAWFGINPFSYHGPDNLGLGADRLSPQSLLSSKAH